MSPSSRRRVAVAGAVLVVVVVLGWLLFPDRESASVTEQGARASATSAGTLEGSGSRASRLDRIRRVAAGRSAALPALTLTGKVVDADDQPVAGAQVLLPAENRIKTSAADGTFAFEGLPPGRYAVEARRASSVGGPMLVDLAQGSKPVIVRLYKALTGEVTVVSALGGKPIEGADVWLRMASNLEPAGNHYGRTGADGKVSFPGVQISGHDLIVSARGFGGAVLGPEVHTREGDAWRIRVELSPGSGVDGVVVDENGKPIEGAMLEAVPYRFENAEAVADETAIAKEAGTSDLHVISRRRIGPVTGADGRFWLSIPAEDRMAWVVVASHPKFQSLATEPIFLTGAPSVHKLTLTMQRGVHAAGWVVTGQDEPVAGARIEIRWQATSGAYLEKTIQADGRGHFETTGLPPAPMLLVALSESATSRPLRVDFTHPSPDHDELLLVLDNTGEIEGVVVDSRGTPLPGIPLGFVELGDDDENLGVLPGAAFTGVDGRFVIRGVMPGVAYHVSASRPQNGELPVHMGWVEAKAGDNVRIRIPDGGSIVGRVVVDGGKSPVGVRVMETMFQVSSAVDASGKFSLSNLPPSPYELDFSGPGFAHTYVKSVMVEEGKATDVGEVRVRAGRAVSGIVTTSTGQPIPAHVRVEVDGKFRMQVISTKAGRFKVTVPSGVPLVVYASDGVAESKRVVVSPAGESAGLRLKLEPGGTIHGTAMASSDPMVNYVIAAYRAGPRPAEPSAYVQVDAAGAYRMEQIFPGTYDVELIFPSETAVDVRVYRKSVKVEAGATVEASFDGTPGPSAGIKQPPAELPELPTYEVNNETS